jgi:DNA-binding PadR family transcriptional regulator
MQRILGPFHRLSWGTLYPLIRRLEQQGLITSTVEAEAVEQTDERGQGRKVYYPTQAGRDRFFALMLERGDYTSDYPELFTMKFSKFPLITVDQQLLILHQYRAYLTTLREHYAAGSQQLKKNPGIGEDELPYLLQIAEHHIRTCDAELAWLDDMIKHTAEKKE